jgi:MbtH protein
MFDEFDDNGRYIIILDQDGDTEVPASAYCLWPEGKAVPRGWQSTGQSGSKQACIQHLQQVWTDMRPLAVHKELAELARRS